MDKIIKITLGLLIVILAVTIGFAAYNHYIANAYTSSLKSSYTYTCSLTTDMPLTNITLFIPVPADINGNSPIVSQYSARKIPGIPPSWQTALFDTQKATLVKVSIPEIIPPAGTTAANPYTFTIAAEIPSDKVIDTAKPVENGAVFHPVSEYKTVPCSSEVAAKGGSPVCGTYLTSLYADYTSDPNARVTIASTVQGKNRWAVFEPRSNEYSTEMHLLMLGENRGWSTIQATVAGNIGSYEAPFHTA